MASMSPLPTGSPDAVDVSNTISPSDGIGKTVHKTLVINEVDYDQPGNDSAEFIELFNPTALPIDLRSVEVVLINGANGERYRSIPLTGVPTSALAPQSYFVICGNSDTVPNCDLPTAPKTNLIQNGAPDVIVLKHRGTTVDQLIYESTTGLADSPNVADVGLSRCGSSPERQITAEQPHFVASPISPGGPNNCAHQTGQTIASSPPP